MAGAIVGGILLGPDWGAASHYSGPGVILIAGSNRPARRRWRADRRAFHCLGSRQVFHIGHGACRRVRAFAPTSVER